jgi:hypothetical protein
MFIVAFAASSGVLLRGQKYALLMMLVAIFAGGVLTQRWRYFWWACIVFFSLLSLANFYNLFGGLEPNRRNILNDGDWISLDFFLFIAMLLSALLAGIAGLREERRRESGS